MATPALRIGCPLQAPLFDVDEARSTGRAGRQRDGHSSGLPSGGDDENAPSPFDQGKNEHCKGCRQKRWQQPNDPAPEQSANLPQQSTQRHGQEGNNIARHVTLHAGPLHYWYYQPVEQPWCGPAGPPTPVLPWKWRGGPGTRPKRPPAPQQTVEQTNVKWETMFERLKTYKNDYGVKKTFACLLLCVAQSTFSFAVSDFLLQCSTAVFHPLTLAIPYWLDGFRTFAYKTKRAATVRQQVHDF